MPASYESDVLRDWYLLFHYGTPDEILDGVAFEVSDLPEGCLRFPSATVEVAGIDRTLGRALDLGCAVGRSSFELTKIADEVVGIDFSAGFIDAASRLAKGETLSYRRYSEMHLSEELFATKPKGCRSERVTFEQGDAMNLREDLGTFDVVHAANLLCRLPEPMRFLGRLPDLVSPGGLLILATPATWLPDYTPIENVPPGMTIDFLQGAIGADFERQSTQEVPFLIREHQRKLQLSTAQTSVWIRR